MLFAYLSTVDGAEFISDLSGNLITQYDLNSMTFGKFDEVFVYFTFLGVFILSLNMIVLYLTVKTTEYVVIPAKGKIKVKKGIIAKRIDTIMVENIKDIDINISILERFLGLGTLVLYTSGDMSAISDRLTAQEKKRLDNVNKNVVMNYMSIRKLLSVKKPQSVLNLIQNAV
jgi:uncharacterized membrane protein YdbT with pleckstrin-like domain